MKKFLSYILTFALMFFISAAATVSMAYFGSNGNLIKPNTSVDGSVGNTSLFNGILETFQKKKQFNIKGELELESEELTIPVTIYVNADINDMENMMFEGFILYQKDQVSFAIEFSFYNNTIYLTQNNSNIKIEVKSITDFIDYITELVEEKEQTQKPEINEGDNTNSNNKPSTENKPSTVPPVEDVNPPKDEQPKEETEEGGDILEELMPTLMDALNNMKETLLENELKQVELSVPDLADVVLIVDKNNAPKKVDLTTASFKGYKLKASLELEFNEYIEITNPEEIEPLRNYFNLKELANIVQNIPDLKNFNSNVNFNINNKNVNFNLLANTNNNSYKLNLINNDFGFINNLKLTYVNNDLYLNFNNINVLVSQELINELTNISLDKEILTSLIPEIKESLGTLDLVKSLTNKIQISSAKDVLGLLSVFENFEISKDYITVTVNTNVLGLNIGKIKLTIGYNQENIKQISIQGLEANNNSIDVDIKLETLNQEINVENKESYINVYDFYKDNFDFFKLGELDLDFNLSLINENLDKYNLNSAIKFNLDNNYLSLNLLTKIKNTNVNVEIEYVDDCAFVKINNVKVKMSKAQAKELINNLNLTQTQNFNIDPIINNLTSKLKTINPLELLKVLSIVKDVRVNNEVVCVDINLKDLGYDLDVVVTIELLNNIISKIYVNLDETNNGLDFSLNINSNQISKNNINKNEYLEITEFVNGLNNLLTLTEGEVKVDIDALVNNKDYDLDLLVKASLDESYANINLELNGNKNLDANLTYYNNIAFVNLNNMFVKFESESLLNLIGLIIKTSNITKDDVINQVNSLGVTDKVSNFINSLNLDKLAYIKNITINSSLIELTLDKFLLGLNDDLVLSITLLENSIKYIETYVETDVQNNLSVKIEFVSDLVEKEEVEEDKYLSIEKTLSNIEKLIYSNVLNVSLSVDVFSLNLEKELGFSLDFSKLYENGSLNLDALIKLVLGENNFDLGLIHENGVSYIEYNGLKVLIETNRITESIERVLSLVNIDINNYKHIINKFVGLLEGENITSLLNNVKFENLDIDYEKLSDINISGIIPVMLLMANELKIDSNQISFVVNGEKLGINTDINLVISFNNGEVSNIKLTKLKVFDKFVDVNINIDMNKKDLPGVEEEVKDKYIDIAEITEMIESFKSTFKNLTFSGDITTNLNVNNEKVSVNVKYGAKYVDSKLTAYLKTTILGIDINLYFLNNTIYADIQGMKINVKLNEINKLLSFIQDEFGLKIEKENNIDIPEVSFSEIIGLISTINLDKISEIVYNENTIDVTFINGLNIFVNYNNIINKIKVIYNDFMVEFNIDSISDFTLDIEESKFESYQEIIDLYNSALNTINNLRNIDATLTLNILKDKIANQISVNVLANILENNYKVSLLNNTYGYVNNLNLAYLNNNFYAYVNNYSVLLSEELINVFKGLIAQNITEEDINNIIDFVKDQKTNVDLKVILGALKYIDEIKLTKTSISIKILKSSLGMGEGTIDVTLSHNNNILTGLSVENIKLFGYEFDLDIDLRETEDKVNVLVPETYFDIYDVVNQNINFFNDLALDFDLIVKSTKNQKELLNANIKYDIHNNYYGIDVFVGYKNGHAVQVEIVGDEAYLKVDNVKVKISAEQAFEIISKFDLNKAKEETNQIKNEVISKLQKLTPQDIIKIIASISIDKVSSEGVIVSIKGEALNLSENVIINITLVNNIINSITINEIIKDNKEFDISININSNVVNPNDINEDEYVDVVGLVENVIDLFKSTSGEIDLDIDALIKGVQYILDLDFEGDLNKGYFDLTAELKEGYSIFTNLTMIDGVLYLNINDAYVSVNVETIIGLILGNIDVESMKQEMSTIEKDELINKLMNLVKSFDINLITKIKSVVVNSSYIEIIVDKSVLGGTQDLVVKIDLLNNVPYIVTITNLYINSNIQINSLVLNFAEKTVEVKELEDKYLSIEETIEKAQSMLELKDLNAIINVDILNSKLENELGLSVDLKKHLENSELSLAALITLISEDSSLILNTRYLNETFFASFNGLNVMLEKDNIVETVHTILSIIGLNENMLDNILVRVINYLETGYISNALKGLNNSNQTEEKTNPTSNFDIKEILDEIINNVQITASEILIDINGSVFGFDSNIYVIISLNNGYISNIYIQELKLEDKFININISLDRSVQNIEKLEIDEKPQVKTFGFAAKIIESLGLTEDYIGEFINLAELTKVIESGYNTIKDGILTGSFGVNFGGLELDINYGFKLVNGKIDAYVSTEYEGINVGVQFTNKTFYVEIQGMKVHANIENIKDIVEWVEDKFGVEINEDMVDEIKSEIQNSVPTTLTEIIDTINSIDFSILDKVVFNENTMEVILSNGETLFASYKEKIEQIRVNVGGVNVEANINTAPSVDQDFEIEVNENEYTSYTALTDLYSMLKETISLNKNFSLGLDININENNINLDALIDVNNRNVSILLNNNSYGYLENANIVIINSEAYIQINDLYVRLTENLFNDAPNLINDLIDKTGMREQLEELKVELEQEMENSKNIDFTKYLQYIKELSIKENGFVAQINANIFGLGDYLIDVVISHENGVITGVRLSNLDINGTKIDAKVSIEKTESAVAIENAEQYLDIYETVLENIEFFNNKALELEVNFEIVGEVNISAIGNIKADLNKNYFGINLEINGDYNANITLEYVNEVAYLSVNGIKVQTSLDKVQNILKEFGFELDIESGINNLLESINKNSNNIEEITFEDIWNAINKLELTSSNLIVDMLLEIFGINSNLDLVARLNNNVVNGLSLTNFEIKGLTINTNIDILSNNVKENQIETEEYLDIAETILNAKELIYANIINLLANVRIYDSEFNYKFGLDLDLSKIFDAENNYLLANSLLKLLYNDKEFNISSIYENDTMFADINGLKVYLEKERILESVQSILSILNINENNYNDIVMNIISLLEGKDILSVVNNLNVNISTPKMNINYSDLINTLIRNVEVGSERITISMNGEIFGYNENINVVILIENNKISSVVISKLRVGDYYFDINLNINTEEKEIDSIYNQDINQYLNIAEFINIIDATYKTLENKQLSGLITLSFTYAGETNLLNINYGVKFDENDGYIFYITTNFKGLDVNIYYINERFYLDIVGMKIYLTFNDINEIFDWLGQFGLEIDFDVSMVEDLLHGNIEFNISTKEILNLVFGLDLNLINSVIFGENTLEAYLKDNINIFVNYIDVVKKVIFRYNDILVELNCSQFNDVIIDKVNVNEYASYTVLTNTVDAALETINKQQFNLNANAKIYENNSMLNNLDVHLALDLVDKINAYLSFVVDGNTSTDINAAYQNDYLYVNYDNLKLSINQKNFRELLVIALEALGVDPTAISFLADIADEMDIKADNINNIMPNLDFGNPLNLLRIVKHIDIVDGNFMIVLDGAFITNDESANDMTFNIYSNEEGIKAIELLNIYAGKGSSQHFDLRIDINDFEGVKQITNTETYIDISGSANLLESFVNTSNLNDYTVTGTIQVVANIIGINIDMDIPVTVKVKIVEDGNIEAYAVLDIPVIGSNVPGFTGINVNNDVPYDTGDTSVESRKLELMIKDNYVYMHRTDVVNQTVFADRIYEKALKVSTQEFSWNLTYYLLQYGIGMSDAIMGEIDKAFDKAVHREDNPLDISNVLNGYTHVDGSNKHTISINLAEIANNELLGNANIDIYTVNNETTGNKDYIGTLGFVIDMPLASVCTINLETNNLSLINIGQTVDLSNMYSYVNSYSYKENQQWEYTDGNKNGWVMADEVEYTINFSDPMGNNVNSITTTVKSPITLPTLSTIVKNEADGQHTYTFAGWFLDEGLTKEFTETVMPRGNRTLYAKWNESVKYNRTVTLNSMGANQDSEITQLEGSVMVLPNLNNYEVMEGQTKIVYSFAGWFLDESCSTKFTSAYMPNENKTLYAKWVEVERFTAYNMIVYDNGKVVFDKFIQEGTSISFSGFKLDSNTKFYSDYALTNEISKPTIMPSNNLVVHIKNMYTLTIISSYGTVVNSTSNLYQGSSFSLPAQKTYVVDNGTTRTTYTFNGYNNSSNIMPNNDLTVTANWSVDVKHYYTVTFNLCYNGNAAFYKYAKLYKNGVELGSNEISVKVLEGSLDLTEYTAVWEYKVIWKYWYNFQGFSTSKNGSAMSTVQITENTTIYGLWSGLKS